MTGNHEPSVPIMIARKPEDCLTGSRFLTAMKSFVEESNCRARNSSSRSEITRMRGSRPTLESLLSHADSAQWKTDEP